MAFTVENGSGVRGATSYATVQGFKDYHADRGNDVTAISDTVIQQLLIKATDYIDTRWGPLFMGCRQYESSLISRSVLTLTDLPLEDETVVIGSVTYTFKASPDETVLTEIDIGINAIDSLEKLIVGLSNQNNEDFGGTFFADPDTAALTIFTTNDGVATTETLTNGSFDNATSTGKSNKQQPLEFPRESLRDAVGELVVGIPEKLKEATHEYALLSNTTDLDPNPVIDDTGLRVIKTRERVDVIEEETEYAEGTEIRTTRPFPAADRLLAEYVRSANEVIRA